MIEIQERKNGVSFLVQVLPRSSKCAFAGIQEGIIRLKLTAPPVEGRANEECLEFFSELLGIKKGQMSILHGQKSRKKIIQIDGLTREQLEARLSLMLQTERQGEGSVLKRPRDRK
ncbi:hypothetical protein SAMN04489760_11272 [Syntrophus gentianae]|uniref:UPF0235 protein SAMN04489760_11272 n=1 Tax=Syntrophus gentianae TaxID=43775 RepID=A0A1H7XXQ5_9BACT|nr:DUF167 domain-containing protein [Syntrophus gentianae]SEM37867.1 hypothetical protein SAMN04489760_11272 [Syntrophus gentianae]